MNISSIGLLSAAVVALLLAVGEVCNKKVVEGQEVVAAVFWIRVFAVLEFTVVLLVFALKGSLPFIHAPAALVPGDLRDVPVLVDQLRYPANPVVQRIAGSLSETTRRQLAHYSIGASNSELSKALSEDLSGDRIIRGSLLYNPRDFADIRLSAETKRALNKNPHGEAKFYTNRLLLEDLFPGAIAKDRGCALFGMKEVIVPPWVAFTTYLLIEVILVAVSQSLFSYALKISSLSLCVPFAAFAPVFLLGTGYVVLRELPTGVELMGIGLIVIGGILMHRGLFAVSWKAPIQAIVKDRGSRYVLLSTLIGSIYGPVEKQLILMSDPLTTAFAYGLGTMIAFWVLCQVRHVNVRQVMRQKPGWAVLSGLADANTMFAQFVAVMYLPVVIVICIKRGGIVLTVLAGWLVFKERDIVNRLIAASAMAGGIAIFYLPLRSSQALTLTGLMVAGLAGALYLTRRAARERALVSAPAAPTRT